MKKTTKPETPRWIEYHPLSELKGNPANPKDHDLGLIHESIRRWSFTGGVLLDERTGMLAAGHGRLEVLRQMEAAGGEPPDGIVADPKRGWLLPVQHGWSSKDDTEAIGYVIGDNRIGEAGGWDEGKLADALAPLAKLGALEGVGFDGDDLDELLKIGEAVKVHEVDQAKATKASFWLTVKGPLPAQADVLDMLKLQLKGLPGLVVESGVLTDKTKK